AVWPIRLRGCQTIFVTAKYTWSILNFHEAWINKYKNNDPRKLQFQKANDALVRILRSIVDNCRDKKKVEKARSILNTKVKRSVDVDNLWLNLNNKREPSINNENDQLPEDYCSLFNDGNEEELSHLIDDNVLNEETNLPKFNEINLELEKSLATNEARNESNNPFQRAKIGHKADMKGTLKNTSCKLEALYGEVSGGLGPF
ncbi:5240_t:CDS:2, partial [Racocetra fulgida]